MSETFRCDDKEMLVAYLYGEIDTDGRREVERHLRTCAACTRETEALHAVRDDLQGWLPPEPALGVAVMAQPDAAAGGRVLTTPRWRALGAMPVWAQVAAASLAIAASAAIANVQVRSTADGFVISTGWMSAEALPVAATAAPAPAPAAVPQSEPEWRTELAALEQTLREALSRQQVEAANATAVRPSDSSPDTAAVLRRVQAMIAASEERQRQEMAFRLTQAERTWNLRRQTDLNLINQRFGALQGQTFAVQAGQQEMMNRLRRVSVSVPPNQ